MLSPGNLLDKGKALVGNDAGWLLAFFESDGNSFEIGRDDYYAEIEASLPDGLGGGRYSFTVEGLIDAHYAELKRLEGRRARIELYLYWRDTASSVKGYVANVAGLTDTVSQLTAADLEGFKVADLAIVSVTRRLGARRYEAVIEARELVFDRIASERVCAPLDTSDPFEAARQLLEDHAVPVEIHSSLPADAPAPDGESPTVEEGRLVVDVLRDLGREMEVALEKYGRGMFLVRDGTLHIGARPIPVDGAVKDLTLGTGLLETETLAKVVTDPTFDFCAARQGAPFPAPPPQAPTRDQYKLTLKGRADLKPGDVVRLELPQELLEDTIGSKLGSIGDVFGGPFLTSLNEINPARAVHVYVASAEHRLGRTSAFVTTITGVKLSGSTPPTDADFWDVHTRRHVEPDAENGEAAGDEARVIRAVRRRVSSALEALRLPEVGEVREVNTTGADEPPSQTSTVWRGLTAGDARPNQGRRLGVERPSPAPAHGVAYTSPFAFGRCGLVLPRYPGTRVLIEHRNGRRADPIDIGALWESGRGPDSEPGDWWLILPVDFPADKRAQIPEDASPEYHTGKVSHDLIDAAGRRIIEVGDLTIRVGKAKLRDATASDVRPMPGTEDAVTIENAIGSASLVIKKDGSIEITGKSITLDAGTDGTITLRANTVDVNVQSAMNVS